jgi:hypothetical protein
MMVNGSISFMQIASASNLDPTGLALLEQGIVKVTGTPAPSEVYTGGNQTYTVYGE